MRFDALKFEATMLRGLFAACLLICALVLGAMLRPQPREPELAAHAANATSVAVAVTVTHAPTACALPPDGVVSLRSLG